MSRRFGWLLLIGIFSASASPAFAQDPNVKVNGSLIDGPANPADFAKWIADMRRWRHEQLVRIGYDDAEYERP